MTGEFIPAPSRTASGSVCRGQKSVSASIAVIVVASLLGSACAGEMARQHQVEAEHWRLTALGGLSTMVAAPWRRSFAMERQFRFILFDAHVTGVTEEQRFILDSGAPFALSPALAERARSTPAGSIVLEDTLGRLGQEELVVLEQVAVEDVRFRRVTAARVFPGPPSPLACLSSAGLFGATALRTGVWQLDFEEEQIHLANDVSALELGEVVTLPMKLDAMGVPRVEVSINGQRAEALVDLGSNRFISVPAALARRAGISLDESVPHTYGEVVTTVYGSSMSTNYRPRAESVRLGAGLELRDIPLWVSESTSSVVLGIDFFEHFLVTLDWPRRQVHLRQQSRPTFADEERPTMGFFALYRDGAVVVTSLWRGGAAERAGLELGDRLLALDGHRLDQVEWGDYCQLLRELDGRRESEPERPFELVVEHEGVRRELVLLPERWPPLAGEP